MDIGIEKAEFKSRHRSLRFLKGCFIILLLLCLIVFLIIWRVQTKYSDKITDGAEFFPPNVGLVLGAGLKAKGAPSDILEDRILTAIELYKNNRIGKFIMSGDNSSVDHNEVEAMKQFALAQGLPEEAIILDPAGLSTYNSCERVKSNFGLSKVIVITQKYHLRRALYLCNEQGVEASGVPARDRGYFKQIKYSFRELLASVQAWLQINF
jgi:vancomycin permeability regulator SanA